MLNTEPYPYLDHLLGAYFHQDAFDEGDTAEQIIEQFKASSRPYEVLGTRADIQRFLAYHERDDGFLELLEKRFHLDVIIAETDDEARLWLRRALDQLSK